MCSRSRFKEFVMGAVSGNASKGHKYVKDCHSTNHILADSLGNVGAQPFLSEQCKLWSAEWKAPFAAAKKAIAVELEHLSKIILDEALDFLDGPNLQKVASS